jgi:excisionase family DNA binding protein
MLKAKNLEGQHKMKDNFLTVNDAAKLLDRSGEAVRVYERQGKLPAIRTAGGVRLFKQADVESLKQKLEAKESR